MGISLLSDPENFTISAFLRATPASQLVAAHGNSGGGWDIKKKTEVYHFYTSFSIIFLPSTVNEKTT